MDQTLLTLPVRGKRDALVTRQRARQLAALLGFDFHDQACIAAGVFALAWQVMQLRAPLEVCFEVQGETFRVFVRGPALKKKEQPELAILRLEKRLPAQARVAGEDLGWAVQQLDRFRPGWMYEEMHRVNQELLATLHALHVSQTQQAPKKEGQDQRGVA